MVVQSILFSKSATIRSIYLVIILTIFIPIAFSENVSNLSIDDNITANYQKKIINSSNNTKNITQINNELLGGESHEDFFSWVTGISNVGTFIAALIALFTLLELKKQRQLSNTPRIFIVPGKKMFEIFWTKIEEIGITLPFDWQGENIEEFMHDSELPLYNIPLEIINAGLSPALNTKITWKFDHIPELTKSFNELGLNISCATDKSKELHCYKIVMGKLMHAYSSLAITPVSEIEYILPYSNIESEKKIFLPPFFSLFVSLSLAISSLSKKIDYPIFPPLTGFIEYSDLSETIHKSEFEVELNNIIFYTTNNKMDYEDGFKSGIIYINIKMKTKKNKLIILFNKVIHKSKKFLKF